jgi:hypothetical protein
VAEPLRIKPAYRNGLEKRVGEQLSNAGVSFGYEPRTVSISVPQRKATYLPDFWAGNIIIETKGYFYNGAKDRQKLILVKEQHPELDVRIVFTDANKPIYKPREKADGTKSKPATYGKWATDHGFKWADKGIVPASWIKEMLGLPAMKGSKK